MGKFSEFISVERRYSRAVNLERDLERSDSVLGYVLGPKAIETLERFIKAYVTPNVNRAWTLTGVYGTGKSSFAHFLTALSSCHDDELKSNSLQILADTVNKTSDLYRGFAYKFPKRGLIRAVATAQNETICNTIIRALFRGASLYWTKRKPKIFDLLATEYKKICKRSDYSVDSKVVLAIIFELAAVSDEGLLLIIDELGKSLEFAVHNQAVNELYILQQIAELPTGKNHPKILFVGILHQSFSDYAHGLGGEQKNEWAKIQGRFEDVLFTESYEQLIRVMAKAIQHHGLPNSFSIKLKAYSLKWKDILKRNKNFDSINANLLLNVYPLHPLTAVILPFLCNKYAQNDRTLFTFLTGNEPYSFQDYLTDNLNPYNLSTFKIADLYDYFIEGMGGAMAFRPEFQRWVEVKNRIEEAKTFDPKEQKVLKTIGILNLLFSSGSLRASKELVVLSLLNDPDEDKKQWCETIQQLIDKGIIIWRKQADELRLWEGSDFNIDAHIAEQISKSKGPIANLLNQYYPFKRVVAQRHSYITGTVRYFDQRFFDNENELNDYCNKNDSSDGLICFFVGDVKSREVVSAKGRPVVMICANKTEVLERACLEYVALRKIKHENVQLQHDGVARREVSERLLLAHTFLDKTVEQVFDVNDGKNVYCIARGKKLRIKTRRQLNILLSDICDEVYSKGPYFQNELINRRSLSTQSSKARRVLIEMMINNRGQELLGIQGYGPERSIFDSLLIRSRIYVRDKNHNVWYFTTPSRENGLYDCWKAIENFCLSANNSQKSLIELYATLLNPPYGLNRPIVPLLFTAVMLSNSGKFGLFKNGTFIPSLSVDDVEMIDRKTEVFSVRYFEISGIKTKLFNELEKVFSHSKTIVYEKKSEASLLSLVRPFIQFVNGLPVCTVNTKGLSSKALSVRKTLLEAREPDVLLFHDLPLACGFDPITASKNISDDSFAHNFRCSLEESLVELHKNYDLLLERCKTKIREAFDIPEEKSVYLLLRERAKNIANSVIDKKLKAFILTASNSGIDEKMWLKSLIMIVADKSPESWIDEDFNVFEFHLSDLARRFKNFEALQEKISTSTDADLSALQITLTNQRTNELTGVVWVDEKDKDRVKVMVDKILENPAIKNSKDMRNALLSLLAERILKEEE